MNTCGLCKTKECEFYSKDQHQLLWDTGKLVGAPYITFLHVIMLSCLVLMQKYVIMLYHHIVIVIGQEVGWEA